MNSTKGAHKLQQENSRVEQRAWKDRAQTVCRWSMLPLHYSDQQPEEFTSSNLWDLDMRI